MNTYEFLTKILHLENEELLCKMQEKGEMRPVQKGEKVFCEGIKPEYVALLAEGVFRGYSINTEGTEITDCIVAEAGYAIMPDFDLSLPAAVNIEALTKGMYFRIPLPDFYALLSQYPAVGELYQKAIQKAGQYHIEKARIMSGYSARKRYQWFLQAYPGIANRISDRYIASFLLMTPVTLSLVRRGLREMERKSENAI